MLFTQSELYECAMFKGTAHAYWQAFMLNDEKRVYSYYLKYEA